MPNLNNINFYDSLFNEINTNNYLVCYPHNYNDYYSNIVKNSILKKIIIISEPIKNTESYKIIYNDLINNVFDIIIGYINHDLSNNKFKFLLPYMEFSVIKDYNKSFIEVNNYVKNITKDEIIKKKFCTLINIWDPKNVRTCIFNKLNTIDKINCPSKLFNNYSNVELNKIGKPKYINFFLFNICSENFDNNNLDGYITEKLMDCCLGCAIPIYAGWFDEYDEKIYNKNRILFYNSLDNNSIENIYNKIILFKNNPEKLIEFYKQPVFCDTAYETIEKLKKDFFDKINNI